MTAPAPEPPPPPPPPSAVVLRREIKFIDGEPVLTTRPQLTRTQVQNIVAVAVATAYDGPEPEFQGMSNMEVAAIKIARRMAETGDAEIFEDMMDRIAGKAKTVAEVHKTIVTYEDKLKQIAARRASPSVVDAEIVRDPLEGLL